MDTTLYFPRHCLAPAVPRSRATARRRLVAGLAALALLPACAQGDLPAGLDYGSTRLSAQGAYRVSYTSPSAPVPINRLHSWTLHVRTPEGQPVTDARIAVDGDMPQHRHGLPTRPRVTRHLGNGDYLVEGLKFQMGGWWVMNFTIDAAGRSDVATFNLMLKP